MTAKTFMRWQKNRFKRWWAQVKIGKPIPVYGSGKFASLYRRRGGIIDITAHDSGPRWEPGTLVFTSYQPNHGFLVEYIDVHGNSRWTNILSYADVYQMFAGKGESNGKS